MHQDGSTSEAYLLTIRTLEDELALGMSKIAKVVMSK